MTSTPCTLGTGHRALSASAHVPIKHLVSSISSTAQHIHASGRPNTMHCLACRLKYTPSCHAACPRPPCYAPPTCHFLPNVLPDDAQAGLPRLELEVGDAAVPGLQQQKAEPATRGDRAIHAFPLQLLQHHGRQPGGRWNSSKRRWHTTILLHDAAFGLRVTALKKKSCR